MKCDICRYSEGTEKSTWLWCRKHGKHVKPDGACQKGIAKDMVTWVKAKAPEDERDVLACVYKKGIPHYGLANYSTTLDRWVFNDGGHYEMQEKVDGWMELPEPPGV